MKKFKINYGLLIFIAIVFILFLPIIIDYYNSLEIEKIDSSTIIKKMESSESFVVYIGEPDKAKTKVLRKIRDKKTNNYSYKYSVYIADDSKEISEIFGEKSEVAYVIEGDIQKTYTKFNNSDIINYADIYMVGNINDNNKSYSTVKDFSEYKNLVKSEDVVMSVFGRNTCGYCNLFKVAYNAVASKYDVDIYYFDSDSYDKDEYKKIVNMDLVVPAKCNSKGKDFKLSEGFGTPLTIFTKDGEVIDCISGYVNRKTLIEKLESLNMISE